MNALRHVVHLALAVAMAAGLVLTDDAIGGWQVPKALIVVLALPIAVAAVYPIENPWPLLRLFDAMVIVGFLAPAVLNLVESTPVSALGMAWLVSCGVLALVGALLTRRMQRSPPKVRT